MKQHFLIKYLLTGIAQLWLMLSFLNCLLLAFFLITGKDGYLIKNKNLSLGNPNIYKNGYPVPAKLSIAMPADTIVSWKHDITSSSELTLSKDNRYRNEMADSILNDTTIKKQFCFYNWVVGGENTGRLRTEGSGKVFNLPDPSIHTRDLTATVENHYFSDVTILLKSKSTFRNFMFSLYSLVSAIVMLLISFNIVRLLIYLRRGDNFLSPLYKRIFNIGIILIIWEIVNFLLGILYSKWYGIVRLEKVSSMPNPGGNEFNVQFNPSADFSGTLFLFGLSLIVLASLFKYGNQLEKENALTI
jgi:hypothetical protein